MPQIISVPYQGPGFLDDHAETLSRLKGVSGAAVYNAHEMGQLIAKDGKPELIVMDYGWSDAIPHVLYETLGRDEAKSIPVLVIKNHGIASDRRLTNYLNVIGAAPIGTQFSSTLSKIIQKFLDLTPEERATTTYENFQPVVREIESQAPTYDHEFMMSAAGRKRSRNFGPNSGTAPA
ncbi:MAG: hypothetical protein MRY79_02665 [Alphaproteobacteria bacterium]|nr:hypothetical protein [Alphaproteobacteria bacterium]